MIVRRSRPLEGITRTQFAESTIHHVADVRNALRFFIDLLERAGTLHDADKTHNVDAAYNWVTTRSNDWFSERHLKTTRHHLNQSAGVPADVNLLDVLEYVADCVMSGLARRGEVYDVTLDPEVLTRALANTVALLKAEAKVVA